jgi:hypothetical protein
VHDIVASTASHPNVRDDRDTPLGAEAGWRESYHIFLKIPYISEKQNQIFSPGRISISRARVVSGWKSGEGSGQWRHWIDFARRTNRLTVRMLDAVIPGHRARR